MHYLRKIGLLALCVGLSFAVWAQETPQTEEFEAAGIKVILRQSVKGTVSARLFIEGGAANYPKEKEGIAELTYQIMVDGGPAGMDKQAYQQATESIGASIGASAGLDYSNVSLNCVKMYWDEAWDLFAKTIAEPAFRPEDFELTKNRLVTGAKQKRSNPDAHLMDLAMEKGWSGTHYEKKPDGTVKSLEALTLDDVKDYHRNTIGKQRVFLVVVGDVSKADLTSKIEGELASLPEGSPAADLYQPAKLDEGLYIENRNIETNYIMGSFSAPEKGSDEAIHNSLAMSILKDRFFEELRTKRSLSYAPHAGTTGYIAHPMNIIYITTTDPKQSLEVMMDLVNEVKTEGFTQEELDGTKQSFLTGHFMGQERNASISMTLGVNEIRGSWRDADKFTERVLETDLSDVNTVMKEHGNNINWVYLGKEDMVSPEDFTQPVAPKKIKK